MIVLSPVKPVHETDLAWLVDYEGNQYWVPQSECRLVDDELHIPQWLAEDKRMV